MNKLSANLIAALFAATCLDAAAAGPAKSSCVQPSQAEATGKSGPRQTVPAPAADGTAAVSSVGNLAGGAGGGAAAASYAKVQDPNAGMPNRISMNVTVPKQTQGATFGEKVNQGLHAAGGAVAQGASASPGAVPGCDVAGASALKEKTRASDASAGAGAGTAVAEKKVDTAAAAEAEHK